MDESFPAKQMIHCATSGSEATLHIIEQIVRFKIPDKSVVDHTSHSFTGRNDILYLMMH